MGRPWAQAYFNPENGWTVAYWQDSGRAGSADSWTTFPTEEGARAAAARFNVSNRPAAEIRLDVTAIANVDRDSKREAYRISEPALDDRTIVAMMFRNTITGRMLRWLADRGEATQAAFMDEYHRRCERTNPSRSSFDCNFGRFRCGRLHVFAESWTPARHVKTLHWCGPTPEEVIKILTGDPKLRTGAFMTMERMLTCDARNSDDAQETYRWLVLARDLKGAP